jgi:ribosomal protein S18 acetylase RimI-like enzyme
VCVTATVRRAIANDAPDCARIHVLSWKAGYRGMVPDEYLESLTAADRLPWWELQLGGTGDPDLEVFVAEDREGSIRGFASAGPSGIDAAVGVIAQLYVDPAAWGTGVARDLLAMATDSLKARNFEIATLGVARDNLRARRFYEREGWWATGTEVPEELWGVEMVAVVYRREL